MKRPRTLFLGSEIRYVVDRGDNVDLNAFLEEALAYPESAGNFCDPWNVNYCATSRSDLVTAQTISAGQAMLVGSKLREGRAANVCLVGQFANTVNWRGIGAPGRMRLVVINPNGNESVCAPIEVEAVRPTGSPCSTHTAQISS